MRLYQSLPICFSVVLSCILFSACDKNPAEKQPLHSEKPSPSPEYAIINTIDAMDKGDSAQLVSTFLSTSRAKVIDSFMEVRKMMSGASGTTTVPWKVQIQRTDIDKSNPNTAIVIFSLEKDDSPRHKPMDSLYQRVFLEDGKWRHGKFNPLTKEDFLKTDRLTPQ